MPFLMPKKCRAFFRNIFLENDKTGTKLGLLFDEYYFCLMAGFARGSYITEAELESSAFIDHYPGDYFDSRDYIAGLLIVTEAKLNGIPQDDANSLERLMTLYIDSSSKTRLNTDGEGRLNLYAAKGMEIIKDYMSPPVSLEDFLENYFECFESNLFFRDAELV